MRDLLEQHLATRLRELGETVPEEVVVPADLQLRVNREVRRARRARRWPAVAVAAAIVAVVGSLAIVRGAAGHGSVRVSSSPSTSVSVHDALQPGTALLSSYDHFVVSLDARGRRNATMVNSHGVITYARATDLHHAIWYLSHRGTTSGCGDVVRADVDGHSSTIVARAVQFDVSRDGSRLALYGAGDLAHDSCMPVRAAGTGRVVVIDLTTLKSSELALDGVTSLRWSLDGSSLLAVRCTAAGCSADRIDVPAEISGPLDAFPSGPAPTPGVAESVEFGPEGLYVLRASSDGASASPVGTIDRYDPSSPAGPVRLFDGSGRWRLRQVVPTEVGTYVVAAPARQAGSTPAAGAAGGLYRLFAGRLIPVRAMSEPVTLSAVTPLPGG